MNLFTAFFANRAAALLAALLTIGAACNLGALRGDDAVSTAVAPAPGTYGDDATVKQTLLGVWTGGPYDHKLGADGVLYEKDQATCKWEVKGGRFYEVFDSPAQPDKVYDILVLVPTVFCYRAHPSGPVITWSRMGPNGGKIVLPASASATNAPPAPIPATDPAKGLTWGVGPQPPLPMTNGDTANRPVIGDPAKMPADNAHDLELKKKLLGYWESPRHKYCYATDGFCYMMEGATSYNTWDVKDGLYYQYTTPCDIITLTDDTFAFRPHGETVIYTEKRTTKAAAEAYAY